MNHPKVQKITTEEHAETVRMARELRATGLSYRMIAMKLNELGRKTFYGNSYDHSVVKNAINGVLSKELRNFITTERLSKIEELSAYTKWDGTIYTESPCLSCGRLKKNKELCSEVCEKRKAFSNSLPDHTIVRGIDCTTNYKEPT